MIISEFIFRVINFMYLVLLGFIIGISVLGFFQNSSQSKILKQIPTYIEPLVSWKAELGMNCDINLISY